MHLFSESGTWETRSIFVKPNGTRIRAGGESEISISDGVIKNRSFVIWEGIN
jgi:hypothetical protein